MNFITVDIIFKKFLELDQENLISKLNEVKAFIMSESGCTEENFASLITAIENNETEKLFSLLLNLNIEYVDLGDSNLDDMGDLTEFFELLAVYVELSNKCYGDNLNSVTFIGADYFADYLKQGEIDQGNIAEHLISNMNWEKFADEVRIDYSSLNINAPNALGIDDAEYLVRN